ncbi:MAG TPA: PEGA domain-containing protein [Vicinamibacterales bacterium]|nr:PEGA domain-containing protein [Vicinamibacterales bacterium]
MSPHKRFLLTAATLVVAITAFASTASAQRFGRSRVVVVGGYYRPFLYDPFWYDPWFAPYGFGWYPPYRGAYLAPEASVKFDVKPKQAEVYVDGYYAGIVDDFDGAFQRLHILPGEHELELYLDGYRPVKQKIFLTADNTFKVKYNLEKLAAGEQAEPRPQPVAPPVSAQGQPPMPPPGGAYPAPPPRGPVGRRPPQAPQPPMPPPSAQGAYGSLAIRVQPNDAEVSIDGEPWRGPGGQDRLVVEVSEGSHTIEIRKSGYRTYVTQVDVRRGTTTPLNVSLRSEP